MLASATTNRGAYRLGASDDLARIGDTSSGPPNPGISPGLRLDSPQAPDFSWTFERGLVRSGSVIRCATLAGASRAKCAKTNGDPGAIRTRDPQLRSVNPNRGIPRTCAISAPPQIGSAGHGCHRGTVRDTRVALLEMRGHRPQDLAAEVLERHGLQLPRQERSPVLGVGTFHFHHAPAPRRGRILHVEELATSDRAVHLLRKHRTRTAVPVVP